MNIDPQQRRQEAVVNLLKAVNSLAVDFKDGAPVVRLSDDVAQVKL